MGYRCLMGRGTFEGMISGFSHMPPSTVPSGPDVRVSPHAVDQRSDWPATEAVKSSVTLNFPNEKFPL